MKYAKELPNKNHPCWGCHYWRDVGWCFGCHYLLLEGHSRGCKGGAECKRRMPYDSELRRKEVRAILNGRGLCA